MSDKFRIRKQKICPGLPWLVEYPQGFSPPGGLAWGWECKACGAYDVVAWRVKP